MPGDSDPTIATVSAPGGLLLTLHDSGRLAWSAGGRALAAGDGLAAVLADIVATGDLGPLDPSAGRLRAQRGADASARRTVAPASPARETPLDVDQTNLSVVVDGDVVVKLVGSWGAGDRAADLLASLAGTDIAPTFRGALHWEVPGRGESTVALATQLIGGGVDGWTWAVDDVLAWLAAGQVEQSGGPAQTEDPAWPRALGSLVASLHARLGGGAAPVAVASAGIVTEAREQLGRASAAVAGTDTAARLAARRASLEEVLARTTGELRLPVFPAHGDLHVGQLLRRPGDDPGDPRSYRLIDFDGDPQLTGEERDRPVMAAVDLAHLLTSIDLVASVAQRRVGSADPRLREWAARARNDTARQYRETLAALGASALLGEDADAFDRLVGALEVTQLAREMLYAIQYLPRWLYAPDGALAARFPADRNQEDPPWTLPASPTTSA